MINTNYLYVVLLLFLVSCKSEQRKEIERKNEFIYEIITDKNLDLVTHEQIVLSDRNVLQPPSFPPEYTDELAYLTYMLKETDIPFVEQQLKTRDDFSTAGLQEKGIRIVSGEDLSQMELSDFLSRENIEGFYSVSMPVFNKAQNLAYIRIGYFCGSWCGGGQEVVLEKENNKWRVRKELGVWVY